MKTRILATALMIIFTMSSIAIPVEVKSEDSLSTTHLAVLSGSNGSEMMEYEAATAYLPSGVTNIYRAELAEWVESRETWESEASLETANSGNAAVDLEGWVDSREDWERFGTEVPASVAIATAVSLDNWVNDMTTWEQESSSYDLSGVVYINNLEEWFDEREVWEQARTASGDSVGTDQQDWMKKMIMWEQK